MRLAAIFFLAMLAGCRGTKHSVGISYYSQDIPGLAVSASFESKENER